MTSRWLVWTVLLTALPLISDALPARSVRLYGKGALPQEVRFQKLLSTHMDRAILNNSKVAQLAHTNREAFFRSAKMAPFKAMATLSAPTRYLPKQADPLFALQNDKMALAWFEPIEKDLAFLQDQREAIYQAIRINRSFPSAINYTALVAPEVRKIYIGEEHGKPLIYQAVTDLLLQYHAKYPDRKLILLTEFVSDRLFPWQIPGKSVNRLDIVLRRNNKDFAFLNQLLKAGVEIVGLENVSYIKEHEALITPSDSQAESVVGLQERNAHWRRIISHVAEKNPQAILFIYTGSMHTHYRAPFTLANPSPQNFVLQLESGRLAKDMPFGFVMYKESFTHAFGPKATVLTWSDKDPVFRTRSGFDACIILPEN